MSIFSSIVNKIFGKKTTTPGAPQVTPTIIDGNAPLTPSATITPAPVVDVSAILNDLAAQKSGKSDWRHSIVDLLKLLDLDSSLSARKELANELNVHVGETGTAEQNLALHKAVMQKLAANGGKVPDELKH